MAGVIVGGGGTVAVGGAKVPAIWVISKICTASEVMVGAVSSFCSVGKDEAGKLHEVRRRMVNRRRYIFLFEIARIIISLFFR
jgi:hypothetical protein